MQIITIVKEAWDIFIANIMAFLSLLIETTIVIVFFVGLIFAKLIRYTAVKIHKLI